MAKRFTDTDLWDKEWFMSLSCKHKCLVRFIFDKCDQAGVWSANWALASAYIGDRVTHDDLSALSGRIEQIGANKYFIPDFIEFQYGQLTESCRPHKKIISLLQKHGLYERVLKGYPKGIDTLEEKDTYKEEEKEEAKKDMGRMLDYIDKLNELDTTGVEPMSHVFPVHNVFREDVVINGDGHDATLANAPAQKDDAFKVPKTVE